MTASSDLSRIVVVLDHPQDVVNVAGVIRAMKNMGLSRLRLVRPDDFDPHRIEGIAHRSTDLVEATEIVDTLDEAVADCVFVVGTTARGRTANRNYGRPRELASEMLARTPEGSVALLFGREDRGLTNEDLDRCHAVTIIPTHPEYSSINLAQACLVLAYEVFLAVGAGEEPLPVGRRATRPPTQEELEATYAAIEAGLHEIEFYKARQPEAVMRTLRTIISRAEPDLREAKLLAAVGHEIRNYIARMKE